MPREHVPKLSRQAPMSGPARARIAHRVLGAATAPPRRGSRARRRTMRKPTMAATLARRRRSSVLKLLIPDPLQGCGRRWPFLDNGFTTDQDRGGHASRRQNGSCCGRWQLSGFGVTATYRPIRISPCRGASGHPLAGTFPPPMCGHRASPSAQPGVGAMCSAARTLESSGEVRHPAFVGVSERPPGRFDQVGSTADIARIGSVSSFRAKAWFVTLRRLASPFAPCGSRSGRRGWSRLIQGEGSWRCRSCRQ